MGRIGRVVGVLVSLCFVFSATTAFSFGIPKIGKKEASSASSMSLDDVVGMQKDLVTSFIASVKLEARAKEEMALAFDNKELAAQFNAEGKALEGGSSDADLGKITKNSEASNEAVLKLIEGGKLSSAESKAHYTKSLGYFGLCSLTSAKIVDLSAKTLTAATDQISNASFTKKMSVKKTLDPILVVGPKLPGYFGSLLSTGTKFITYAKDNDIKVLKDPNDVL